MLASAQHAYVATAMTLAAVEGGAQASARSVAGLMTGQQADWVVLDAANPLLQGLPTPDAMLSTHVFASHRRSAIAQVWVAGQQRVAQGRHVLNPSAHTGMVSARRQMLEYTAP